MTDIRSLEQTLIANLLWNRARIKFVARFLLALFAAQIINLSLLATVFPAMPNRSRITNDCDACLLYWRCLHLGFCCRP
jgi:hypothetical protein